MIIDSINILKEFVLPIFISLIAVKLALYKNKSEKWWDKKYETYSKIISALYEIKLYCDKEIEISHTHKELDEKESEKIHNSLLQSQAYISEITVCGIFYLSKKTAKRLKRYKSDINSLDTHEGYLIYINSYQFFTESCISDIIKFGKKEVGVKII